MTTTSTDLSTVSTQILKTDCKGRIRFPAEMRAELLDRFEQSGMSGADFVTGAVFKGVGDKDVESHFTFKNGKAHVSTYLNLDLMEGQEKPRHKIKRPVDRTDV